MDLADPWATIRARIRARQFVSDIELAAALRAMKRDADLPEDFLSYLADRLSGTLPDDLKPTAKRKRGRPATATEVRREYLTELVLEVSKLERKHVRAKKMWTREAARLRAERRRCRSLSNWDDKPDLTYEEETRLATCEAMLKQVKGERPRAGAIWIVARARGLSRATVRNQLKEAKRLEIAA